MIKTYVKKTDFPTVKALIYENNNYPEIFEFLSTKYPKMIFSKDIYNMISFLCYENITYNTYESKNEFHLYPSDVLVLENDVFKVINPKKFHNSYLENKPI